MKYKSFFLIDNGKNGGLFKLKVGGDTSNLVNDESASRKVRVVSNTSSNNGVERYIYNDNIGIKNCITIGTRGNDYLACYQDDYTVTVVRALLLYTEKFELNEYIAFYICGLLRMNEYKCAYGRVLSGERIRLERISLPIDYDKHPDWVFMEESVRKSYDTICTSIHKKPLCDDKITLNTKSWKSFKINELFDRIEKAKCNNADDLLIEGSDIFYIGAKKNDNGIMKTVESVEELISEGNCIVFIGDGQGSVGYSLYHSHNFIGSTTLTAGYVDKLNKYNAMFLVSVLDLERYRYSFGRKYGKDMVLNSKIKLPVTKQGNNPDWEFMESYIKCLAYSSSL